MESPGAKLKKLRLEKGIGLEEVHKKTKIHLNILKAIEEDSLINVSPVYIKGFLKIYCKFLGVDPEDFVPDYKKPQNIFRHISDTEKKPISFLKTVSIKLVSFKPHIKIKTVFIVISIIIFAISLFNLGKIIFAKRSSLTKETRLPTVIADKTETKKVQAKSDKTKTVTITPKAGHPEVTVSPDTIFGIRLAIRAKENCWIQLKVDGRVVFQNILKKGRFESWQAKDKIELSLGNAGVVDLEVNGKLISSLGRRGQVLKNILITKEGLSISR